MNQLFVVASLLSLLALSQIALGRVAIKGSFAPGRENEYLIRLARSSERSEIEKLISSFDSDASKLLRRFEFSTFLGVHVRVDGSAIEELRSHKLVKSIERNGLMKASYSDVCSKQIGATWGIERITERMPDLDGNFIHNPTWGESITAYVIDTGIYLEHNEFNGRAVWGGNFVDDVDTDCNGHGTHVAGTIGGQTYGISRDATLVAVKVLDCEGSGSYDAVIGGIEWMVNDAKKRRTASTANMSLGGPKSEAIDDAIEAAVNAGVVVAVAAGNENQDACDVSPANVPAAITVGATGLVDHDNDEIDARASFSNFGPCVDILAPGALITSAWIGEPDAIKTISGTSMATPHVAGVATSYLTTHPTATPKEVTQVLLANSTNGIVSLGCSFWSESYWTCTKTPNKMLYWNCGLDD